MGISVRLRMKSQECEATVQSHAQDEGQGKFQHRIMIRIREVPTSLGGLG